jgi:hypothetical protein
MNSFLVSSGLVLVNDEKSGTQVVLAVVDVVKAGDEYYRLVYSYPDDIAHQMSIEWTERGRQVYADFHNDRSYAIDRCRSQIPTVTKSLPKDLGEDLSPWLEGLLSCQTAAA